MSNTSSSPVPTFAALEETVRSQIQVALQDLGGAGLPIPLGQSNNPKQGDLSLPCFSFRGRLDLDERAKNNPAAIAQKLAEAVIPNDVITKVSAAGPYLNITLNTQALIKGVLSEVFLSGERFGESLEPSKERIAIEFSAPNTNKPQHLGHVRNDLLGESVSRILDHHGADVIKVNLINDRGIHICKSMLAYQRWGDGTTPEKSGKKGDHLIGDFYVLFEKKFQEEYSVWRASSEGLKTFELWLSEGDGKKAAEALPRWEKAIVAWEIATKKAEEEAAETSKEAPQKKGKKGKGQGKNKKKPKKPRCPPAPEKIFIGKFRDTYFNTISEIGVATSQLLMKWEQADPEVWSLWSKLNAWVIAGFDETYKRLGVSFAHVYFESETYKLGKSLTQDGLEKEIFRKREDGAIIFDLEKIGLKGEKVLLRSNGTSVYMTQDLGTAVARHEELSFDRMIYVVGDEQNHHFKILFGVLGTIRPALEGLCEHLSYGMVHLLNDDGEVGKMKSREGTVVDADNLMSDMQQLAFAASAERAQLAHNAGVSLEERARRAEFVGMAALKYFLLDITPQSSMKFNPEKSLDFAGRTGAYCLYNYARTRSLIRRSGGVPDFSSEKLTPLGTAQERALVMLLKQWPRAVERAAENRDPSKVTEFLFTLCKGFAFIFTDKVGHPIAICEDPALRDARLLLVDAFGKVLKIGLSLLGIETLEEM